MISILGSISKDLEEIARQLYEVSDATTERKRIRLVADEVRLRRAKVESAYSEAVHLRQMLNQIESWTSVGLKAHDKDDADEALDAIRTAVAKYLQGD